MLGKTVHSLKHALRCFYFSERFLVEISRDGTSSFYNKPSNNASTVFTVSVPVATPLQCPLSIDGSRWKGGGQEGWERRDRADRGAGWGVARCRPAPGAAGSEDGAAGDQESASVSAQATKRAPLSQRRRPRERLCLSGAAIVAPVDTRLRHSSAGCVSPTEGSSWSS